MASARPGHDQLMRELTGSASVRPSQIKKSPPPPVAPKPKVVSQRGPEIQTTSSDDFPAPPHHAFGAADDLPPPPPELSMEFSVTGVANGGDTQPIRGPSTMSAPMFTVKPFVPANATSNASTAAARWGPKPFKPAGSSEDGAACAVKPPASVDYPPPPPPLLTSSSGSLQVPLAGAPVAAAPPAIPPLPQAVVPPPPPALVRVGGPQQPALTMPAQQRTQPNISVVAAPVPFGASRPSPPAPSRADVMAPGSAAVAAPPAPPSLPFVSSATITLNCSLPDKPSPAAAQVSPPKPQPFAGHVAPSVMKQALPAAAPGHLGQADQHSNAAAGSKSGPPTAGAKTTIDLSFAAGLGPAKDQGGQKPVLSAAPASSGGSATIKPYAQVPAAAASPAKAKTAPEAEVDSLTDLLIQNLESAKDPTCLGICAHCNKKIAADSAMCTAMDKPYHIDCFACSTCSKLLTGQSFYLVRNAPQCESCYTASLEKCSSCQKPITDRILRATGKAYHALCFTCVVCRRSLDGVPFTVDANNEVYCVEDFHMKYAPRCSVCQLPIMPDEGQEETVRIVALDRNFHIACYKCEDCGLVLSSEADGRGCYPLDGHVLCRGCNSKRVFEKTTGQSQAVPVSNF